MAAEQAHPADLHHAQELIAGLEASLRETLEETLRLTGSGEHDAAIIRIDAERRSLDERMDALARDVAGITLVPEQPGHRRRLVAIVAAAAAAVVAVASVWALTQADPTRGLASRSDVPPTRIAPEAREAASPQRVVAARRAVKAAGKVVSPRRTGAVETDHVFDPAPYKSPHRQVIIVRGIEGERGKSTTAPSEEVGQILHHN